MDGFRLHLQAEGLSQKSILNYTGSARYWLCWCKEHEIDHLTATKHQVAFYLGQLAEDHLPTYVYCQRVGIKRFYDYLITEGFRPGPNPAAETKLRPPRARTVQPFSVEELRRMWGVCANYREQAVFLLFMSGALRRGEVFRLCKSDCDFENGTIAVLGKRGKYRTLAFDPQGLTMTTLALALAFDEQLCPFKADRMVYTTVQRIGKRAGIHGRIYPHRFRHSAASNFLDAGGSVEELQIWLGHETIQMSLFYAQAGKEKRALKRQREIDLAGHLLTKGFSSTVDNGERPL